MKTIKRLFLQTVFAIVLLGSIVGCETDCEPKETIVENKLTPEILSYFPYDSLDTIHCIIDSQQYLTIQSFEKVEGIEKSAEYSKVECNAAKVYYNHYRIVRYFDQDGRLVLNARLQLADRSSVSPGLEPVLKIDFDFYNISIKENYGLGISTDSSPDTLTFHGHFYDDIYTYYESARDYTLYYSKAKGLVLITAGDRPLFRLIQ